VSDHHQPAVAAGRWNDLSESQLSRLTARLKRKRVERFVEACRLDASHTILDLGSEDGSYLASCYPYPQNIVLADIDDGPMREGVRRYGLKGYEVIPRDGALPFSRGSFDAVWCNSVIEHVTLPRAELAVASDRDFRRDADAHQQAFASEVDRVGRSFFVQTPYLHFPVEAHSWLPLMQYLPQDWRWTASRALRRVWVKKWKADFLLYDEARFARHFPGARIEFERVFGLTKALIAIKTAGPHPV
jgi:hypothetical protein